MSPLSLNNTGGLILMTLAFTFTYDPGLILHDPYDPGIVPYIEYTLFKFHINNG